MGGRLSTSFVGHQACGGRVLGPLSERAVIHTVHTWRSNSVKGNIDTRFTQS